MQIHGSLPYAEIAQLGLDWKDVIDFSANVNPYPLPFEIPWKSLQAKIRHYPDSEGHLLKSLVSRHLDIDPQCVLLCGGATELIYSLARIFPQGAYLAPSYGDYGAAHLRQGQKAMALDWNLDIHQIIAILQSQNIQILWVCQPNNPTGTMLKAHELQLLLDQFSGMVVLDEAYLELSELSQSCASWCQKYPQLVVLKSWTKPYALAGLRASYALCHPSFKAQIESQLLPWSINVIAEEILPLVYEHHGAFEQQWQDILSEKSWLIQQLQMQGWNISSGHAPYFLLQSSQAEELRSQALQESLALRNCASFGLPDQIRLMPQLRDDNLKLLEFLAAQNPKD